MAGIKSWDELSSRQQRRRALKWMEVAEVIDNHIDDSSTNEEPNMYAEFGQKPESIQIPENLQEGPPPPERTLGKDVAEWADHRVPHENVREPLNILQSHGLQVPSSVETLKKSGRLKIPIRKCAPGHYMHYG
ncbi:hypothetical protein QAD02_014113 [Eretmocerus hayati]|uniref:Uncharacterized protein n=1 Tax=Eretmocerus hayati TaxID=131215 RepID=A0ACC2P639_9HYME|nr:hypothetical protein QAD02_014113 [Eretmocerus hayati]